MVKHVSIFFEMLQFAMFFLDQIVQICLDGAIERNLEKNLLLLVINVPFRFCNLKQLATKYHFPVFAEFILRASVNTLYIRHATNVTNIYHLPSKY